MSPDNMIVFIDRDRKKVNPKEFRTPPPPSYEEYDPNDDKPIPLGLFYNASKDPNTGKFEYLDSKSRRMKTLTK